MRYDATLKSIFQCASAVFMPALAGARPVEHLSVEFATVSKRQPDLVFRLEDDRILHIEIQVSNHPRMAWRMLLYYVLLSERYPRSRIEQVVLYAGQDTVRMTDEIRDDPLHFKFRLYDFRDFQPNSFLASPVLAERVRNAVPVLRRALGNPANRTELEGPGVPRNR